MTTSTPQPTIVATPPSNTENGEQRVPVTTPAPSPPIPEAQGPNSQGAPPVIAIAIGAAAGISLFGLGAFLWFRHDAAMKAAKIVPDLVEEILPLGQPVNAPESSMGEAGGAGEVSMEVTHGTNRRTHVLQAWGDPASMQLGGDAPPVSQAVYRENPVEHLRPATALLPQEEALELQAFDDSEV